MKNLLKHFKASPFLGPEDIDFMINSADYVAIKKNEMLSNIDRIQSNIYFIEEGLVRTAYEDGVGCHTTLRFFMQGQMLLNVNSSLKPPALDYNMIAIEDTSLYYWDKRWLEKLEFENNVWLKEKIRNLEIALFNLTNDYCNSVNKNALNRYRNLVKMQPEIIQRVPGKAMASFLNVTPERLSRIRGTL